MAHISKAFKVRFSPMKIASVCNGYSENKATGAVTAMNGKLNIRPDYQREFIYKLPEQKAVIDSILGGYPLSLLYFGDNGSTYETIDGQQRTISICEYIAGNFSIPIDGNLKFFHNLTAVQQKTILNYELAIYIVTGSINERLEWFKRINLQGEPLTLQEMRSATYRGDWVTDAKAYFVRQNQGAYILAKQYMTGSCERQAFLEKILAWHSGGNDKIEEYMAAHQHDKNAAPLYDYFKLVIQWVKNLFTDYTSEMRHVDWGYLYNKYKDKVFDSINVRQRAKELMLDDDVSSKSGIYAYLITGDDKYLNIRQFSDAHRRAAFTRQDGKCCKCGKIYGITEMEADHITPWSKGGKTNPDNCQMLCISCNRTKSNK